MSAQSEFGNARRREIFEFVEQNGAVEPETVRQNVLVRPKTHSKPARSGADLDPSTKMSEEEFNHHLSMLKRDGYLEEDDGKLRVAMRVETDATTVDIDGIEAVVRPARQEDMAGIVSVIETIAAEETYVVAARLAETVSRDGVLLRRNQSKDRVFFVATVGDDEVGWLHIEGPQFPSMDHTAELTLGVLERYRGEGLGTALMDRGLDWAATHGLQKLYQSLPATNEGAVSFLETNGWSVESSREGHYQIDDELVDEVQLAIWLD